MGYRNSNVAVAFEPDVLLPSQLLQGDRMGASGSPERRLMLAVLEEAVATYQRYVTCTGRRGSRLFREAEAWIMEDEASWPCSFRSVCDVLGLDPGYLRHGLERWRDRERSVSDREPALYRTPFRRLSGSRTRAIVDRSGRSSAGEGRSPV